MMSVQREDYRTNRADYVIAAKHGRANADGERDDLLARKKNTLWLRDRRSAKLAANPWETSPELKARPCGYGSAASTLLFIILALLTMLVLWLGRVRLDKGY